MFVYLSLNGSKRILIRLILALEVVFTVSTQKTVLNFMDQVALDFLNKQIKEKYGYKRGIPRFRIVWANDEFEKRFGTYTDWTNNGVLIREVTEVRLVPKYPIAKDRYILETVADYPMPNLVDSNGYECLWKFQWADGS